MERDPVQLLCIEGIFGRISSSTFKDFIISKCDYYPDDAPEIEDLYDRYDFSSGFEVFISGPNDRTLFFKPNYYSYLHYIELRQVESLNSFKRGHNVTLLAYDDVLTFALIHYKESSYISCIYLYVNKKRQEILNDLRSKIK